MRVFYNLTLGLTLFSITLFSPYGKAIAASSTTLLRKLEILQIKNQQKLTATDKIIEKIAHSNISSNIKPMGILRNIDRRKEYLLRRDFLNRILVQIDSHYKGEDQASFLIKNLGYMAEHEAKSSEPNRILLRFILNCKNVLIDSPKGHTDPVELLDRFMNFTTISKLKTPALFYEEQDYSNGTDTFKANVITTDQIGAQVENKIKSYETRKKQKKIKELNSLKEDLINEQQQSAHKEEQMIERRLKLAERLRSKNIDVKKIGRPLKNVREVKPTDEAPLMNQEQFKKLFKAK